ncbi:MAG: DUF424 family protein [Nanoarchaeota archaeon]|nr:DUF424 family protein [Nanoarchaeota archaeon]MBU4299916.1 DUF424 family protein [Nanoarchaeota archaeon]MBU4451656.1 DUF424 family protein [Nanoarchaeota archaeon]MCG2724571.1 DUF424 family protein [archaeon]
MFFLKIHESDNKTVCAICDSGILGKIFEENERVLDVDADFFGGEKMPPEKIKEIADSIKSANTSSIIGNRIIAELVKMGALKECSVKEMCGIKYAMVFRIRGSS